MHSNSLINADKYERHTVEDMCLLQYHHICLDMPSQDTYWLTARVRLRPKCKARCQQAKLIRQSFLSSSSCCTDLFMIPRLSVRTEHMLVEIGRRMEFWFDPETFDVKAYLRNTCRH